MYSQYMGLYTVLCAVQLLSRLSATAAQPLLICRYKPTTWNIKQV